MNRRQRQAANARRNNARKHPARPGQRKSSNATSKAPRVNQVSAFWANDQPGGIGVSFPFDDPEVGFKVCRTLQNALAKYDAHKEVTPDFCIAQLRAWGSRGGRLTDEEMIIAITNIYWLQERGHLTKDEFNGVIFACTVEGSAALMMGEQNPLAIDLDEGERDGIDVTDIVKATVKAGPFGSNAAFTTVLDYARKQTPKPKTYYLCLAVQMKDGGVELRRLRTTVEPSGLGPEAQALFVAKTLHEPGIRPKDVADLGTEGSVAMSVWDTEGDCKAAYDVLVAKTNAKVRET